MRPYAESAAAHVQGLQSRIERELAVSRPYLPQIPWDTILGEIRNAIDGVERTTGRAVHLRDRPIRLRGGVR